MILCIGTTPAVQRVMVFRKVILGAVNRAGTTLEGAAGKGINVAKVLQALGEHPVAIGCLGGDRGELVRAWLARQQVEMDLVPVAARTRQCLTLIDQTAGLQTELVEESPAVTPAEYEQILEAVRRRAPHCRAAVMSGTIAPGIPADFYQLCVKLVQRAGALSIVDAQGQALLAALPARPALIKPNRTELAASVGHPLPDEAAVMAAMREMCLRGAERCVVTAGGAPALAFDGHHFYRVRSAAAPVVNPIGSGDAFCAALVWRLLRGDDLGEACRWASAAGTANALTLMPGEVAPDDVERLVQTTTLERL